MSLSIRSPTVHSSRASISTGIASCTPSTSRGSVNSSARKKPFTGSLKKPTRSARITSSAGSGGSGPEMNFGRSLRSPLLTSQRAARSGRS